jgi:hypothetical protein
MARLLFVVGVALASGSAACGPQATSAGARAPGDDFGSDGAAVLCAGLPTRERVRPSFLRQEEIEAVRPLEGSELSSRRSVDEVRGAEIFVRRTPALTRTFVVRVLRCHLADPIALALREPFENPLLVGTPRVSFESSQDRFVIRIAGHDAAEGREILRRAEALQEN